MAAGQPQVSPFGHEVRRWRALRRMSQLDLAVAAGTTARHMSFVETGRSRPGKDLILRVCDALQMPLPDRNALLAAAGLARAYPDHELGAAELEPVDKVLTDVLGRHDPYPAWVMRQPFTFLRANAGADALFPGLTELSPEQLIDLWFGPGPFRDRVLNWREVLQAGLSALRVGAADSGDPELVRLLRRAERNGGELPPQPASRLAPPQAPSPVVCPVFEFDGQIVRTISAVMRFDTAVEVTTSRLRIELMFPADAEAEAFFRNRLPATG